MKRITVPFDDNLLVQKVLTIINSNKEIQTLWKITNVTAINRLGMTDHGQSHFQIVVNNALTIERFFNKKNIQFSISKDYDLPYEYGEVVILLASLLHDLGMSIHRVGHEEYSLFLVNTLLREILNDFPVVDRTILISEVLHAIISHRSEGRPLTIEAGIVRVADALDMTKGRSRLEFDDSTINIHSVSAMAIDEINILEGKEKPVKIEIIMNHTAGLFQIDELLKKKVIGSGIEEYLDIQIYMDKGKGKQLFKQFLKRN